MGSAPSWARCSCDGGRNHSATLAGEMMRAAPRTACQKAVPGRESQSLLPQECLAVCPGWHTEDVDVVRLASRQLCSPRWRAGTLHTLASPLIVSTSDIVTAAGGGRRAASRPCLRCSSARVCGPKSKRWSWSRREGKSRCGHGSSSFEPSDVNARPQTARLLHSAASARARTQMEGAVTHSGPVVDKMQWLVLADASSTGAAGFGAVACRCAAAAPSVGLPVPTSLDEPVPPAVASGLHLHGHLCNHPCFGSVLLPPIDLRGFPLSPPSLSVSISPRRRPLP